MPYTRSSEKGKRKGEILGPSPSDYYSFGLTPLGDYFELAVFFCASRVACRPYSKGTLVKASAH